jgi:flagellar hook-associated protein FlgK
MQCAIPVLEGLLPEPHNEIVMTLLFRLAEWHALAKLRLHADSTLSHMDSVTTVLGQQLRRFMKDTCSQFKTKELPKEYAARGRRENRKEIKNTPTASNTASKAPAVAGERKSKILNLAVYKVHALGDYVNTIRLFGTTDSFSSQIVSLKSTLLLDS